MEEKKFKYKVFLEKHLTAFGECFNRDVAEAMARDAIGSSVTEERDGELIGVESGLKYTYTVEEICHD